MALTVNVHSLAAMLYWISQLHQECNVKGSDLGSSQDHNQTFDLATQQLTFCVKYQRGYLLIPPTALPK